MDGYLQRFVLTLYGKTIVYLWVMLVNIRQCWLSSLEGRLWCTGVSCFKHHRIAPGQYILLLNFNTCLWSGFNGCDLQCLLLGLIIWSCQFIWLFYVKLR